MATKVEMDVSRLIGSVSLQQPLDGSRIVRRDRGGLGQASTKERESD